MSEELMNQMVLIGEVFATYQMLLGDEIVIVKMEDYSVPGRENSRCYREYLAFRLASRIGLSVPHTSLFQDAKYGRLSIQQYLHDAALPSKSLLERIATSSLGMRIALFDLLCGNHDRKPDNLLQIGTKIIPVDFNTAFPIAIDSDFDQETNIILARWFQIRGMLSLKPADQLVLLREVDQMVKSLDDSFLHKCLSDIPAAFCAPAEVEQVRGFLIARRDRLQASVSSWWNENVAPLHRFDNNILTMAIRKHMR